MGSMATSILAPIALDAESARVLAAYERAQRLATERAPSKPSATTGLPQEAGDGTGDDDAQPGWVPRLTSIEDLPVDRMAPLHGKLIAQGLLRFQLLDRTGGMVYRLSPEGRSVLAAARGEPVGNVDEDIPPRHMDEAAA